MITAFGIEAGLVKLYQNWPKIDMEKYFWSGLFSLQIQVNHAEKFKIVQNRGSNTVIDSMDLVLISGSDQADNLTNQIRSTKNESKQKWVIQPWSQLIPAYLTVTAILCKPFGISTYCIYIEIILLLIFSEINEDFGINTVVFVVVIYMTLAWPQG